MAQEQKRRTEREKRQRATDGGMTKERKGSGNWVVGEEAACLGTRLWCWANERWVVLKKHAGTEPTRADEECRGLANERNGGQWMAKCRLCRERERRRALECLFGAVVLVSRPRDVVAPRGACVCVYVWMGGGATNQVTLVCLVGVRPDQRRRGRAGM